MADAPLTAAEIDALEKLLTGADFKAAMYCEDEKPHRGLDGELIGGHAEGVYDEDGDCLFECPPGYEDGWGKANGELAAAALNALPRLLAAARRLAAVEEAARRVTGWLDRLTVTVPFGLMRDMHTLDAVAGDGLRWRCNGCGASQSRASPVCKCVRCGAMTCPKCREVLSVHSFDCHQERRG